MCLNKTLLGSTALLLALTAFSAFAQGIKEQRKVSPMELMPIENEAEPAAADTPYIADENNNIISVLPAGNISLDTLGLYDAKSGGLAFTVWEGSDHERVHTLLQHMPQTIPSPTIRQLVARLLLSSTRPPQSENIQQNIFKPRIEMLMHMNEVPQAQRLLEMVPQNLRTEELAQLEFTAHLLNGDIEWVCSNIGAALQKYSANVAYWQKLSIFCNTRAKESAKVELALDVLSEQQVAIDPGFISLIEVMMGRSDKISRFSAPLALSDAALIAISGKDAFAQNYLQTAPLPVARLVNNNPAFTGDVKETVSKRLAGAIALQNPNKERMHMRDWYAKQFAQSVEEHVNFDRALKEAQEKGGKTEEPLNTRRHYRFYMLLQALGFSDISVAEPWEKATFQDSGRIHVSPALRSEMATAVNSELTGEAILLVAMAAGQVDNLADVDDASISDLVAALMQLGLDKEAQAFAAEAMISLY